MLGNSLVWRIHLAAFAAAALLSAAPGSISAADAEAGHAELNASAERLAQSVEYLASDELEGRGVGTKGIDKAAEYIAQEFAAMGLKTELFDGTPFQTFTMTTDARLGPEEQNHLRFVGPAEGDAKQVVEFKLDEGFSPLAIGGSGKFDVPLLFAGYGITAKDEQYDDYQGIDAEGKAVIVLRKTPGQDNPHSPFAGPHASPHAFFSNKLANAATHGAVAVIFVNDAHGVEQERQQNREEYLKQLDAIAEQQQKFREIENPGEQDFREHKNKIAGMNDRLARLQESVDSNGDEVLGFKGAGESGSHQDLPVYFISRKQADETVLAASGKHLAEIEETINAEMKPHSFPLDGWKAVGEASVVREKVEVKNVIAVLEGEGPLADETIVIGAHYDHLGYGGPGSLAPWTTEIHNGADDNASGTAAMLETARQLSSLDKKLPRRVVFMAFTGEERGLIGSDHYVKNPRFPLEKTVAMLNFDMVGRLTDDKLILQGVNTATEFEAIIDRLNESHGFQLTKKAGGYGPSDHASFYPKNIPVIHLFTDLHSDYHRPSDDFETVNVAGMKRVVDFLSAFAVAIAELPDRPTYVETERPKVARGGKWPYFGSVPDYASSAKGLELKDVADDGPADKAGLQGGDIIIGFGELEIGGIEDFAAALSQSKPGQTVKVKVRRGEEVKEFEVELEKPR